MMDVQRMVAQASASLLSDRVMATLADKSSQPHTESAEEIRRAISEVLQSGGQPQTALTKAEDAPDSVIALNGLAEAIAASSETADPEALDRLHAVVKSSEKRHDSTESSKFSVHATGKARVGRIYQANRDINVRET